MFIKKTKYTDEILFKYLGEIKNFLLKQPKRQIFTSNNFSKL